MTKQRHCFVAQVGDAIEALASALDPERKPPFKGDILDLLEWAEKGVLEMREENAQLRQQLSESKEECDVLRRIHAENIVIFEQRLAAAIAACRLKDEALRDIAKSNAPHIIVAMKALDIQLDDSALKAWLGEPVVWQFSDNYGTHYTDDRREWYDAVGIESVMPLYAPKGMK